MDFSKALTYPFEDKDWVKKLIFLLIAGFIPIIGNPIAVQGWGVDTARRVKAREAMPLASWDDIGAVLGRGVPLFLASLVYFLPVGILYCLGFGISMGLGGAAAGVSSNDNSGAASGGMASLAGIVLPCCICIALLYAIAAGVVYLGGYIRFLDKPEFGTFMQFSDNLALVRNNGGDFGMAVLYIIGAGVVAGIVSSVTFGIGGLLATPFMSYFSSHILGQLAIKLSGSSMTPQV